MLQRAFAFLAAVALLASPSSSLAAGVTSGHLRVVTYNVAGLPDGFSTDHPSANMPLIGRLLSNYDLALVQEDFAYAELLRKTLTLKHQTPPFVRGQQINFGDGLSQFSRLPFSDLQREAWHACHGIVDAYFDCMTPKGFMVTRQALTSGVQVDVYDVHLDAGSAPLDARARESQIEQLIGAITTRSAGNAILLAGDTNIRQRQRGLLDRLERETGLMDVCSLLHCAEPGRIDRIYVRNSKTLHWSPRSWTIDRRFVDGKQQALSDHLAVSAELDWSTTAS